MFPHNVNAITFLFQNVLRNSNRKFHSEKVMILGISYTRGTRFLFQSLSFPRTSHKRNHQWFLLQGDWYLSRAMLMAQFKSIIDLRLNWKISCLFRVDYWNLTASDILTNTNWGLHSNTRKTRSTIPIGREYSQKRVLVWSVVGDNSRNNGRIQKCLNLFCEDLWNIFQRKI